MLPIRGDLGTGSYKSSPEHSNEQSELKTAILEAEVAAGIGGEGGRWTKWGGRRKVELLASTCLFALCFLRLLAVPHLFSLFGVPPTSAPLS